MRLLKIGRDGSCDIVLHSDKASSLHAEITLLNNGDILLEDKNSRNGTFIMNRPIKPGTAVNIKRGDAIRFGDVELLWDQIPMPENNSNYKAVYGIGSNFRNDIQISGNTVSRFHATIKIANDGKCYIIDHSKNGTTVNGSKIAQNKTIRIKKSDSVACGGVPVNVSQFIPSPSIIYKMLAMAASVIILLGIGYGTYKYIPWQGVITPSTSQAMENASVCVYGGYYFEVTIKDDPFKGLCSESTWPSKFTFGWLPAQMSDGTIIQKVVSLADYPVARPFAYTGTAFFISTEGEMGTNRHIAIPWEYNKEKFGNDIRDYIANKRIELAQNLVRPEGITEVEWIAKMNRLIASEIIISGKHTYFGIGLTGSKINSLIDLQQCQVIAESGDSQKDVALIRLNSRKTPDYIIKMGAIYDIEHARIDERSLNPQDEELTIVGYPLGESVSDETFDGKELRPSIHRATLSKTPDDNKIQIQTLGISGQSGSPVSDKSHRLVGVLCSGYEGTEVTFCCNIKHFVELYNKNKARE